MSSIINNNINNRSVSQIDSLNNSSDNRFNNNDKNNNNSTDSNGQESELLKTSPTAQHPHRLEDNMKYNMNLINKIAMLSTVMIYTTTTEAYDWMENRLVKRTNFTECCSKFIAKVNEGIPQCHRICT